jgi:hypothetical protein
MDLAGFGGFEIQPFLLEEMTDNPQKKHIEWRLILIISI